MRGRAALMPPAWRPIQAERTGGRSPLLSLSQPRPPLRASPASSPPHRPIQQMRKCPAVGARVARGFCSLLGMPYQVSSVPAGMSVLAKKAMRDWPLCSAKTSTVLRLGLQEWLRKRPRCRGASSMARCGVLDRVERQDVLAGVFS